MSLINVTYSPSLSTDNIRSNSAITIQRYFRGYQVRKITQENFLHKGFRSPCNALLSNIFLSKMPRASSGVTPVYFPPQIPEVVLKASHKVSYSRLGLMCYARKLCKQLNTSSLIIPRGLLSNSQDFLFEERIPINSNFIEQERLATVYSQHPVIKEFTRFVLETGMWDLSINKSRYYSFPWARTDNFPLYLVHKDGAETLYMGLIDLERISTKKTESHHKLLLKLVYVFPHSFDLILEDAREYGVEEFQLEEIKDELMVQQKLGFQRNNLWYADLIAYLDNKRNTTVDVASLLESKKEVIFTNMVFKLSIPVDALPEFRVFYDKFCLVLTKLITEKVSQPYSSVFGEMRRTLNPIHFALPLQNEENAFNDKCTTIELSYEIFLQNMAEHKIIYHVHSKGYRTFITY